QKVEVAVISEPPPPPPPPPPPKIEKVVKETAPPPPQQQPAYVPPPVVAPTTQSNSNTIQASSEAKPAAPAVAQPVATPAPAAPAGPISAVGNCSKLGKPEYPRKADADGIGGVVTVWFKVNSDGKLSDITNIKYSSAIPIGYRSQFQASIKQALKEHVCKAAGGEATLEQEFGFTASSEE
ncbi:MAG: energy transducer TonB, partial [Plesiomonas sp.]